jgi:hypothetical protein
MEIKYHNIYHKFIRKFKNLDWSNKSDHMKVTNLRNLRLNGTVLKKQNALGDKCLVRPILKAKKLYVKTRPVQNTFSGV